MLEELTELTKVRGISHPSSMAPGREQKMRTDVRFPTNGLQLAGHLYLPEDAAGPLAAIVVGHQTTGVKEQSAAVYAARLVKEDFAVLTFDAAFQGESEGMMPRGLEDPFQFQRAEDFRAAVSSLTTRPEVDSDRIGVVDVCGSGAYAPYAAQTDRRTKAVAGVCGTEVPSFFRGAAPEGRQVMVANSGDLAAPKPPVSPQPRSPCCRRGPMPTPGAYGPSSSTTTRRLAVSTRAPPATWSCAARTSPTSSTPSPMSPRSHPVRCS